MFKVFTPVPRFRERLLEELPDSLDRVIFSLLLVCLVLSLVKLLLVVPVHFQDESLRAFLSFSIFICILFCYVLFKKPKYLALMAKLGLIGMAIYVLIILFFSDDHLTFIGIQHMFIIIMMAFYCLSRLWGLVFSGLFFLVGLFYLLGVDRGQFTAYMVPQSYPFGIALSIVLINFIQIAYIHFLYNKTLTKTVTDMRTLNLRLHKLVSAKSEFLSTMSHELRTPLNSLLGVAYLMADGENQNKSKNLETLRFSAEKLLAMINDILDYSKMSSDDAHLDSISFSISNTVEQVVRGLQDQADKKSLRLSINLQKEVKQKRFMGDSTRLTQILYNLIGNAIKFTSEGSVEVQVTLSKLEKDRAEIYFRISDSGIGIDPTKLEYIFEPFSQAPNEINRAYGGTGLGLAIVEKLVRLHQGTLSIESTLGQGTICHLRIPYQILGEEGTENGSANKSQELIHKRDYAHLRVLLAEDNPMSVMFMKQLLSKWGITPEVAINGEEVIRLIQEHEYFDVILMDIRMPTMTGVEATEIIRSNEKTTGRHTYIIALTASVSGHTMDQWEKLGFDDYLSKPFWPNDLLEKIEQSFR